MRVIAACATVWCTSANANPDGAPAAHTGAFGEPSCHACHFDGPARAPGGPVSLDGLPARVAAGDAYELTLTIDADAANAGFQLAVRDQHGRQVGTLSSVDDATRVVEQTGIQYLGHTNSSNRRWRFVWRAPDEPRDVVFAGAVNAANDDQSEFGDEIFLILERMEMEQKR